jgi:arylsulfatase A-like enzyme
MAAQGMTFRDAHASSAVCTPSRYSILTGRYNWRSTLKQGVNMGYTPHLLEEGRMTVASFLRENGYHTACFGKWHLGMDWPLKDGGYAAGDRDAEQVDFGKPVANGPTTCGFDTFYGISASLDMAPYVYIRDDRVTELPTGYSRGHKGKEFWRDGVIAPDFEHEDVLPNLTRRVVEHIGARAQSDQPFFIYFPLPAPHTPILPLPEFRGKSGTNAYGDFCLQVDDTVGQVMRALAANGVRDDTILVFTTDNGCSPMADLPELAAVGHYPSYHFRGHKADIYEGGHRIPLFVQWPNGIRAASVCDRTVCLSDLIRTMSDILGVPLPEDAGEDSVSNLPAWEERDGDAPPREAVVHHSIDGSFSIRQGRWKLELCPGSGGWSDPKPGEEPEGAPPIQLYDLEADIGERANLQDRHADVVKRLKALLTQYVRDGRSTPGAPQRNTGPLWWPQLNWLARDALE